MMPTAAAEQRWIVGREDALEACDAAIARMLDAAGGLLLVAGEAGIGKTTVLQHVAALAEGRRCIVRWAACPDDDAVPAFWPVVRLLSEPDDPALTRAATELTGTGGDTGSAEHRFVVFERVATALRTAAAQTPQVLIVDDLHWADPSSVRLLAFLVKQVRTARVLVVAGYRDTDVTTGHPLLGLLSEPGTSGETITLGGLSVDEVSALVDRARGHGNATNAARLREHTGGNPFFVLHVAQLLDAEGRSTNLEEQLPLPVGVRAVLERRLARLSQSCHQLLGVAGVIGARFEVSVLAEVSGLDIGTVRDLLAESTAARLTQPAADAYEFAHALVRATVVGQLPARRRAELHATIADVLTGRGGTRAELLAAVAHHELHTEPARAASRGVDAAERAGRHAAAARAYEQAAALFERAISACTDDARSAELQLALGNARLRAGDWDAAAAAFLAAADLARGMGRAELFARAALGYGADTGGFEVRIGDPGQLALLEEAVRMVGSGDPALRSRLLARQSVAATSLVDEDQRRAWSDEALELGRRSDPGTLAYALSSWCDANAGPSQAEARLAAATEMLAAGEAAGDRDAALIAHRLRIVALLERGDYAVHAEIEAFVALAEAMGEPLYRWYVPLFRGLQALLRGDLDAAERHCAQAAALGAEAGSNNAEMLSGTQGVAIGFERGQMLELARSLQASLDEHEWMRELPIATAFAPMMHIGHGRNTQAKARLHSMAADRFAVVPVDSEWLSTLSGITMAILWLEDETSAAVMYDVLGPHAGRFVVDGIGASCLDPVDYLLGRLATVLGQEDAAVDHLQAAISLSRQMRAPLLEAHAKHALGTVLSGTDPLRGQALIREAEAVAHAAGADPFIPAGRPAGPSRSGPDRAGVFRQEGRGWVLTFDGQTVRMPDAKGLHDLRYLLTHPGLGVPATTLQTGAGSPEQGPQVTRGVEVLDDHARAAYRQRLRDLDAEIGEAESASDLERAARLRDERAFFVSELSAAVGVSGRSRRMGDDTDRARKAVTMRIRNAVSRIAREHPSLGRHLDLAVRTGTVCSYEPEEPVIWSV